MSSTLSSSELLVPAALTQLCLRWNGRRHRHRPAGEPLETDRYSVEPIDETTAKSYVIKNHYSGSYPAARFRAGLFEHRLFNAPHLVGVAVFSVPMTQALIPKYLQLSPDRGVELGRLVLDEAVPGNGESWFLARAFKLARKALPIDGIVSFCDAALRQRRPRGEAIAHRCDLPQP